MTTHNLKFIVLPLAMLAACLGSSGCDSKYKHSDVNLDSPEAKQITSMIEAVRKAGSDGLAAYVDADAGKQITAEQKKALVAALQPLATADHAKLMAVDRFGANIFRATIQLDDDGVTSTQGFAVIAASDHFHWAALN